MSDYIKLFETVSEYDEARSNDYYEPWVSYTIENSGVSFNKTEYEKLLGTPLTFKVISAGTINWVASNSSVTRTIEYKINDGEWTEITSTTAGTSFNVNDSDNVQFRGNNATYGAGYEYNLKYNTFSGTTAVFEAEGNIMSLIDSTDFTTIASFVSSNTFNRLFYCCTGLTLAENLILPVTILNFMSYYQMFAGCTSLTTAPELRVENISSNACQSMFSGCRSLTTAPLFIMSGGIVAWSGCCYMFAGCTSLTTAPELLATNLYLGCYAYMFFNCTSLTTAPELPATTLAGSCYNGMFSGCYSLTTAPDLPATILEGGCYNYMFSGCYSLTTVPNLSATTLANGCYNSMFRWCTGLTSVPLNYLPITDLAENCYYEMFVGCTSLTTAPELPATTLAERCYSGMFSGCTSLTTTPELPATTLVDYCYQYMFYGCRSLNYIKCLATDISATNCTLGWVYDAASSGTFVKNANMSSWGTGESGIPSGWAVQDAS